MFKGSNYNPTFFGGKFIRGVTLYFISNAVNASIPLMLMPFLTRVLTPADYGMVAIFSIVFTILGSLVGLSIGGAVNVYYFHLTKSELANFISTALILSLLSLLGTLCVAIIWSDLFESISGIPLKWITVAIIMAGVQFISSIRLALWQVMDKVKSYGIFQAIQSALNAALSVYIIIYVSMDWEGRVLGQFLSLLVMGGLGFILIKREKFVCFPSDFKVHTIRALKFGLPLIPHVISGLILISIDRFLILKYLGASDAGIYLVGFQIGQVLSLLTDGFNKAFAPWLMKNLAIIGDQMKSKIVSATYAYFIAVLVLAALMSLSANALLKYVIGYEFYGAEKIVPYIFFGFAFGGCYFMVTNYIFYVKKTFYLALVTFISGVLHIPILIFLIERNGLIGAGQAFLISNVIIFIGTWFMSSKLYPMPWFNSLRKLSAQQ
jgi:O-antigen/teichoic acid export membrane protein